MNVKKTGMLALAWLLCFNATAQERKLYDFVVPRDGNFREALEAANHRPDSTVRFRIFVMQGEHIIPTQGTTRGGDGQEYPDPRTYLRYPNTSIIGEDRDLTVLTNIQPPITWDNGFGPACPLEGIGNGDLLIIEKPAHHTYLQDIKMKNGMPDKTGRNIVLHDRSDMTIARNICLWAYQDSYVSNNANGRYYFEGGILRGRTDYICGKGDVWFQNVVFQQCAQGGYIAVPSVPRRYGYIMKDCYIKNETPDVTYYLGRPWSKGSSIALWIDTKVDVAPIVDQKHGRLAWADMSKNWPARFAEYNTRLTDGTPVDVSIRRTSWTDEEGKEHPNKPLLTEAEASQYTRDRVLDGWDPTPFTREVPAPKNIRIKKGKLRWEHQPNALLYAICLDGKVVDFTINNYYDISAQKQQGEWSVRSANQMGGLSK